jgi:hypothetical protein
MFWHVSLMCQGNSNENNCSAIKRLYCFILQVIHIIFQHYYFLSQCIFSKDSWCTCLNTLLLGPLSTLYHILHLPITTEVDSTECSKRWYLLSIKAWRIRHVRQFLWRILWMLQWSCYRYADMHYHAANRCPWTTIHIISSKGLALDSNSQSYNIFHFLLWVPSSGTLS